MLITAYAVFVVVNVVDFFFTRKIIRFGGKEFNIVMRYVLKRWGYRGVVLFKLLFLALVGIQVFLGNIDLYTISYLSFVYIVVLVMMYWDARSVGLNLLSRLDVQ